ncbi:hypothetical protein BKI52_42475 [marine bacterium AO1-C]|nr:hypothetical protein BKI52_42475 [marine bacterium AO1-C]
MKTVVKQIVARKTIKASQEAIFKIISDHEGTHRWVKEVDKVLIVKEGEQKNGLRAIRKVHFKPVLWTTVEEEIIDFQENKSYIYKIISKMPGLVDHKGVWSLQEISADATEVVWDVYIEFKKMHWFSLFAGSFAKSFGKVQNRALAQLEQDLS